MRRFFVLFSLLAFATTAEAQSSGIYSSKGKMIEDTWFNLPTKEWAEAKQTQHPESSSIYSNKMYAENSNWANCEQFAGGEVQSSQTYDIKN